jgi:hypothetical protein
VPVVPLSLESLPLGPDDPLELPELPELSESLLAPDEPPEPLFPPLLPLLPPPPESPPPLLPPPPESPPPDACAWLMFTTAGATYAAVARSASFLMISRRSIGRPPFFASLEEQSCVILPDRNLTKSRNLGSNLIYWILSLTNRKRPPDNLLKTEISRQHP